MDGRQFQWIRVRRRNLHGLIDPVLKPLLDGGFFDDPVRQVALRQGQVVKDTRVRWAAIVPLGEGKGLFVKRFRVLGRWQSYKYRIAPSRVRREWRISRFLSTRAILTPRPLGVLERREHGLIKESLFMAEALEGGMDLLTFSEDLLRKPKGPEKRDQVLGLLAETTRKIHDAGLFHRDLHGGNFLVVEAPPLSLYLVDLHHARRLPWVPRGKRLWNIAQIYKSLDSVLDEEARRSFLAAYGGGCSPLGDDPDRSQRRIQGMMRTMARRHEKSRAKRCLKESSVFTRERRAGFVVFRRREVKGGDLVEILRSHRQMVEGRGEKLLKYSPKTIVSVVTPPSGLGGPVCVKAYRYERILDRLRTWFRRPKGRISWVAGNLLYSRGISPLKPLAYAERWRRGFLEEAFYVTEFATRDVEMDRYLVQRFKKDGKQALKRFIGQFARWLGSLHRAGIYHRDLKTCNILVREVDADWSFSLIDLEDVIHGVEVGERRIFRNLVQINCSVPKFLSYGDRVRFLRGYFEANPVAMDQKGLIRRVLEESRRRGIVYVSPDGLVTEAFE